MIETVGDLMALLIITPVILLIVYIIIKFSINKDFRSKLIKYLKSEDHE